MLSATPPDFGRGERADLPDRAAGSADSALGLTHGQYAAILHKVFHTLRFDVREFAVDYFGASYERFLAALPCLTYFQTVVYELDLLAEQALAAGRPLPLREIAARGDELRGFLRDSRLSDPETERALAQVIHYLSHEADHRTIADPADVLALLDAKTADLEILLRLTARLCDLHPTPGELRAFRLLERVREVFDDLRDYAEDLAGNGFNAVVRLESLLGREEASRTIAASIEAEYAEIHRTIDRESPARRARFALLADRWRREREYYEQALADLWAPAD